MMGTFDVYLGSCVELMPKLPDGSVDAIVTDPPYMDYQSGHRVVRPTDLAIDYVSPSDYMPELFRVLRDKTAMVLWCRWDSFQAHADAATEAGFDVKNMIVWAKPNHTAGDLEGNIGYKHEVAVFAVKGRWKVHGFRDVNLWSMKHTYDWDERIHPTQKPEGLMERCVNLVGPEGITILDPFMGSGTTGAAALKLGRSFIGYEVVEKYYDYALKRLENTHHQPQLL